MQELMQQIATAWASLTMRQRASLAVSALLTVAAVSGIVWWANQPSWAVLYTGLDAKEAQSIVQELQSRRTPHRLSGGGTVIEVPLEEIDRLRMDLAAKNLPGSGRFSFLEMFSQDTIAQSNSMQRIRYQKALEDELARTIESLEEVSSARVHLVLPGDRVFIDDDDVAKGSVTLGLAGQRAPTSEQVQAIARIVAGAAPELRPERVSVVDTTGRVLWEGGGESGGVVAARQVEMQAAIEKEINAKVERVLEPIVGADHFVVRTTADLDFQKVLREEMQLDPDSGVLVSEQKNKEKSTYGDGAYGVPGTASNLPGEVAGVDGGASEESESTFQKSNFQYSQVKKVVEEPTGSIRKLSVAVLVDQAWEDVEGEAGGDPAAVERRAVPRTEEEIRRIEGLVMAAINYDAERGDRVTVEQAPFRPLPEPVVAGGFDPRSWLPLVKYPALVVLLLLAFLLFYRPLIRTLREAFGASSAAAAAMGTAGTVTAELEQPLQLGPPSRLEMLRQRLSVLATEQPTGMAQTLRIWLHEDEDAR